MASDVDRNINMLFKITDLGLKGQTALVTAISELLKFLTRDKDSKYLKKSLDEGHKLSFCVCRPEHEKDITSRFDKAGIPYLVSASVSMEGAKMIMFSDEYKKEVESILGDFRAEHNRGGIMSKADLNRASRGHIFKIKELDECTAMLMVELAKEKGINVAVENPEKDKYSVLYSASDKKDFDSIKMTVAIQMSDPVVAEALRKQVAYEEDKTMRLAREATEYSSNRPYYLVDMNGATMEVTADKVTFREKGGAERVIDHDDFDRDKTVQTLVGSMNNPVSMNEMEYKKFLNSEHQKEDVIAKDKEMGRPQYTQEELIAMRKMVDARVLYETKLAQDNPEQEIYHYSFTNNEMHMADFSELEHINREVSHDKSVGDDPSMDVYDEARSKFRGYAEAEEELDYEDEELADEVIDNDTRYFDRESYMDEEIDDYMNDQNANYTPDDRE